MRSSNYRDMRTGDSPVAHTIYHNRTPIPTLAIFFLLIAEALHCVIEGFGATSDVMRASFLTLGFEALFFAVIILMKYQSSGLYIFDPFSIVTFTYVLVYLVAPATQFSMNDTARYGVDVSHNCTLGTIVAIVSYLAFYLAYETKSQRRINSSRRKSSLITSDFRRDFAQSTEHFISKWALMFWLVSYAVCLVYSLSRGYSVWYVLTGGLGGATTDELNDSSVGFLAYVKFCLAGFWMMYFVYGRHVATKVATFFLTMTMMFLSGSRAALVIPLIAPIVYWYLKDRRTPKASTIVIFLAFLVMLFAVMQVARVGIRAGAGMDIAGETIDSLFEPFNAEIQDYKSYYILFDVVPDRYPYLFGREMVLYCFILLIPRVIWPGKPDPPVHEIVRLSFGDRALLNGNAYPNLGEFYIEFGIIGCIICMLIFGLICKWLRNLYLDSSPRSLSIITYSLVYPSLFQIVIRGYTPQNFATLLFLLAPIIIIWLMIHARKSNAVKAVADYRCRS